jgi:hypothetical protein
LAMQIIRKCAIKDVPWDSLMSQNGTCGTTSDVCSAAANIHKYL